MRGIWKLARLVGAAAGLSGCASGAHGTYWELAVAEDALLVGYKGEVPAWALEWTAATLSCRDRALLRAAEIAAERGFRYFSVSTPPTMPSWECEVHVRMFREQPECANAVFYDVEITQRSLRQELGR